MGGRGGPSFSCVPNLIRRRRPTIPASTAPVHRRPPRPLQEKRELVFKEDGQEYAQVSSAGWPGLRGAGASLRYARKQAVSMPAGRIVRAAGGGEHGPAVPLGLQVLRMLGNGRLEAMCMDNTKRLCHIRGKMRKRVWINAGDIILVGLR